MWWCFLGCCDHCDVVVCAGLERGVLRFGFGFVDLTNEMMCEVLTFGLSGCGVVWVRGELHGLDEATKLLQCHSCQDIVTCSFHLDGLLQRKRLTRASLQLAGRQ